MDYNVKLTEEFLKEFEQTCDYISNTLKNISASNRLREKIIYNVLLLENSPEMCAEIEKTDRTERQYRKMIVNNYVILYTIDKIKRDVYIAHIYYGGRNYLNEKLL